MLKSFENLKFFRRLGLSPSSVECQVKTVISAALPPLWIRHIGFRGNFTVQIGPKKSKPIKNAKMAQKCCFCQLLLLTELWLWKQGCSSTIVLTVTASCSVMLFNPLLYSARMGNHNRRKPKRAKWADRWAYEVSTASYGDLLFNKVSYRHKVLQHWQCQPPCHRFTD